MTVQNEITLSPMYKFNEINFSYFLASCNYIASKSVSRTKENAFHDTMIKLENAYSQKKRNITEWTVENENELSKLLDSFSNMVAYSILKKLECASGDSYIMELKNSLYFDITQMEKLDNILSKRDNKIRFKKDGSKVIDYDMDSVKRIHDAKDTLSDAYEIKLNVCASIIELLDKAYAKNGVYSFESSLSRIELEKHVFKGVTKRKGYKYVSRSVISQLFLDTRTYIRDYGNFDTKDSLVYLECMDSVTKDKFFYALPSYYGLQGYGDGIFTDTQDKLIEYQNIEDMLSCLTPKQKTIVHYLQKGYSVRGIAEKQRVTTRAVQKNIEKIRKKFTELGYTL